MTALATDNLPLLAGAPNGIQKLRELILGLAIQGKLLAQDAREGNVKLASEALGIRKRAQRESLLKEFSIPKAWGWFCVSDLCDLKTGATPSTSNPDYYGGDIKWLVSGDIHKGEIYDCAGRITRAAIEQSNCKIIQPGAILIALNGQGKTRATTAILRTEAACNQSLVAIVPRWPNFISPEFIRLNLRYRYFEIRDITGQNQRRGLNMGLVGELSISAPPIREQHRIVAKVDELMALCDTLEAQQANAESAHAQLVQTLLDSLTQASDADDFAASWQRLSEHFDTLFTTEASIDALKQTLLQLAVMGKLVPQDPTDEPASQLLNRIRVDKEKFISRGKFKESPAFADESGPYSLPKGWVWARAEQVSLVIVDCPHSTPKFVGSGRLCLDTNSFKQGNLIEHRLRYVDEATFKARNARLTPEPGDIVFAREGIVGESIVIPDGVACCLGQRVMLFRPASVRSDYLRLSISEPSALKRMLALHKGIGAKHVNVGDMRAALVPLPPLAEQRRIVAKVDELMALCDQLNSRFRQARDLNQQLASTLVERAVA